MVQSEVGPDNQGIIIVSVLGMEGGRYIPYFDSGILYLQSFPHNPDSDFYLYVTAQPSTFYVGLYKRQTAGA